MKTISGRFWFVIFGVIVIVAVGSCCCLTSIPEIVSYSYSAEIGNQPKGPKYIPWKDEGKQFENALAQVCSNHGEYDLFILRKDTDEHPEHWAKNCNSNRPRSIRTVKVTKSKGATNVAAGESAVNDPNVMNRVRSPVRDDMKLVVAALEK